MFQDTGMSTQEMSSVPEHKRSNTTPERNVPEHKWPIKKNVVPVQNKQNVNTSSRTTEFEHKKLLQTQVFQVQTKNVKV